MKHLFELLKNYSNKDIYPFHMPGHKRNFSQVPFLNMDITEIGDFDNLNNPTGILLNLNERFTRLFGGEKSFLSVNGATSCVHSALYAICGGGGKIALACNCHKSAFSAALFVGAKTAFIKPTFLPPLSVFGAVQPHEVKRVIDKNPDLKGIFIVSPTYEGICSDIKSIGEICHERGIPLIVDEAHGAHFFMSDIFPTSALLQGADIVIHGLHKTLPFPTQTGLLSVQGSLVNQELISSLMSMSQSSSPSYILMGAAEKALSYLEENLDSLRNSYIDILTDFRKKCKDFININILEKTDFPNEIFDYDMGKLVFYGKKFPISGEKADTILRENKIQSEAVSLNHIILMTSAFDTTKGFLRLLDALKKADSQLLHGFIPNLIPMERNEKIPMKDVFFSRRTLISPKDSLGRISADFVSIYPPGIPLLIPGTEIQATHIELLERAFSHNLCIMGLSSERGIQVVAK